MMLLIQRHYLKEFLKLFLVIGGGLAVTFSLFELIQMMDSFMPYDPPAMSLVKYAALKVPQYALALMPVAGLLCSLYTVSHAVKNKELVAVMAAGGRTRHMLVPFIMAGAVLSLLSFGLSEFVVPETIREAQRIKHEIKKEKAMPTLFKGGVLWFRAEDGSIVRIEYYQPDQGSYRQVSIYRIGQDGLESIIQAREANYLPAENTWMLSGVSEFNATSGETLKHKQMPYPRLGSPTLLKETAQRPNEMGVVELYRYVRRLKEAGFKNLRLTVDLHAKASYPLVSLLMVLIGISFPVRRNMGGVVATAIGLLISLAYWLGYTLSLSMGYAGIMPPVLAAWLAPAITAVAGMYLFSRIPE